MAETNLRTLIGQIDAALESAAKDISQVLESPQAGAGLAANMRAQDLARIRLQQVQQQAQHLLRQAESLVATAAVEPDPVRVEHLTNLIRDIGQRPVTERLHAALRLAATVQTPQDYAALETATARAEAAGLPGAAAARAALAEAKRRTYGPDVVKLEQDARLVNEVSARAQAALGLLEGAVASGQMPKVVPLASPGRSVPFPGKPRIERPLDQFGIRELRQREAELRREFFGQG
jgi:hypothetical protein